MKQWFPFTDYDFYAYLTAGMLVIAAEDLTFGGEILIQRTDWTVVQIVFWTAIAYTLGHLLAGPSSALFEHVLARRFFYPPVAVALGLADRRWRERAIAGAFAGREYSPLPHEVRAIVLKAAAASLTTENIRDPEAVFTVAFAAVRASPDTTSRLDQFRNLYGFSRNVAFASLVAAILILAKLYVGPAEPRLKWLLAASLLMIVGMYGRFLKFYAGYSREVLTAYMATLTKLRAGAA